MKVIIVQIEDWQQYFQICDEVNLPLSLFLYPNKSISKEIYKTLANNWFGWLGPPWKPLDPESYRFKLNCQKLKTFQRYNCMSKWPKKMQFLKYKHLIHKFLVFILLYQNLNIKMKEEKNERNDKQFMKIMIIVLVNFGLFYSV